MRWSSIFLIVLIAIDTTSAGFFDSLVSKFAPTSSSSAPTSSNNPKNQKQVTEDRAKQYLQDFGYVPPSNSLASGRGMSADIGTAEKILQTAIRKFQDFAGLAKTGILDAATKAKMALARCGVTDAPLAITSGGSSSQFKWSKTRLTYSIENYSPDLPRDSVRRAIAEAYSLWSKVTPLEFSEVQPGGNADIKVRFGVNNHNDPWPFDGEGGVLAHATFPESGLFHFDDDENWAYKEPSKIGRDHTDLLAVAIHEGGHTLGLEHSKNENAIMAPFYQTTVDSNGNYIYPNLKADDIAAIQKIYGPRRGSAPRQPDFTTTSRPTTTKRSWFGRFFGSDDDDTEFIPSTAPTTTTRRPMTLWPTTNAPTTQGFGTNGGFGSGGGSGARCPYSIDAYTPSDTYSYAFSGSNVYSIQGTKVINVQPIRKLFLNAPATVNAAVFNPIAGSMLLISNNRVYSYYYSRIRQVFQLDVGYPKTLPSNLGFTVRGAIRWVNGHQILLSDSDDFAVYDEFWNQVTLKNKISSYFPNLPRNVKGIESPSGMTVTAFTAASVVEYDSRRKTTGRQSTLANYLSC